MSETLSRDTLDASATDLVAALAARRVGALELAEEAIARIEARDTAINAVVVRDFDRAREAARAADAALARGERRPLLGLPMTVKESHNVGGLPTTWGFEPFKDFVAPADGVGVTRLKAAGAVILGKTNVPPWLADYQSNNPIYGRTRNPHDLTRTPGGSSGGSAAALAAGMIPLELGSDIGGSIRMPAHFCGVYGHKPSYNLVPLRGHEPPYVPEGAGVVLAVVGPLARTAADLGLALDVLAGPDEGEAVGYRLALPPPRHARLADYRVLLVDQHPLTPLDDEIRAGLNGLADSLETLGAQVARSSDLLPDLEQTQATFMGLLMPAMSRGQPGAQTISAHEWMALLDTQARIRRRWARLFEAFDVVLTPVHGAPAFPHDDEPDPAKRTLVINGRETPYFAPAAWAGPATLGNLPSTAIPVGRSRAGLPFGAQVIGPYLEDRTTLAFAELLEREFGGFRPPPGH
ncbi:amidase family protein [Phenylobacterium sp.]|uniref:amidase family protein n=1 Tax=Phenylobacterium sp. TaxID=1871053 RepID=UPI002E34553B|nr:amidase family protein [Phenylobacterium sp.]HEX4713088.1 amidase family protein [Phenylobacterium sp.]